MKNVKIYKILTYILLPFAVIFALNVLSGLLIAFSNASLLIFTFILACFPIYIYTSSKFLVVGILRAKPCSHYLKDWIKVNAVVTIILALFLLLASLVIYIMLQSPTTFKEAIKQMPNEQKSIMGTMNPNEIIKVFKIFALVFMPFSIICLIHIFFTFRLLKTFDYVFDKA